ncbi:DUF4143 domain-containing protein, partial [Bacteroidota bacterium]
PNYGYERIVSLFHRFCLVGGIPDVVESYSSAKTINALAPFYENHLEALFATISSLAYTGKTTERLEQIYQDSFTFAATRITYRGFSNPEFRSREVGMAFRLLQSSRLLHLIYPTTKTTLPWSIDTRRSPRIQLPDTGLVNYFTGIQEVLSDQEDLSSVFNRQISLHIVAQELLGTGGSGETSVASEASGAGGESGVNVSSLHFWVRDKTQSSAQVDFVIGYEGLMIPVEVKRGEPGRLRSLHQFVEAADHPFAVRLYAGPLSVTEAKTVAGKTYYLMSLPYFLGGKIREHLEGFIKFVGR